MSDPTDIVQYAVYIVIIEDTSQADMDLACAVDSLERLDGDMTYQQAINYMADVQYDGQTP